MGTFLQQITSILVTTPGNLIYHIVLAFCLAASLQAALLTGRRTESASSARLVVGLILVLLAQLVLFAASGLAWQQVADSSRYAPPLDRAMTAFSLVWIVWLWAFPNPNRLADTLAALLSVAVAILGIYTLNLWLAQPAGQPFNGSLYDWYWELSSLIVVFLGLMALLIARPPYWGIGLASLGLLLAGFTANLLMFTSDGDYSGIVRLGQLTSYLMLPVLAQRLLYTPETVVDELSTVEEMPAPRTGPDLRLAQSWSALALEEDPAKRVTILTRAVAQSLRADLAFLLYSPGENGLWSMPGGYDMVTDEALTPAAIEPARIPGLASALQRGKTICIGPEDTGAAELTEIGRLVGLDSAGSLLAVPLIEVGKVWGGMILLSPYANRAWDEESINFLTSLAENSSQILNRAPGPAVQQARLEDELKALRVENQNLGVQISSLRQQKPGPDVESLLVVQQEAQAVIAQLRAENDQIKARLAAPAAEAAPADRETITRLQTENEQLRARLTSPLTSVDEGGQMEGELRLLLQEVAMLKNQLAQANMDLEKARRAAAKPPAGFEGQEIITSISQDFRQPMSGILGYTDLLLADTAGPLTPEQRSFLERIRSSTERLRSMVNDLVRAAALAGGSHKLEIGPTDLETVIDEAVTCNNALLREKNITLRISLPDDLPTINADQQAMQQILVDLLRNAGSISPEGSEVMLTVGLEGDDHQRSAVLFQVTDSGGGIPAEDLPRVFKPQYQAGEALVQGTADAGSGLPVVEALVKAQGGDVWVDSVPGQTARFTVRLPLTPSPQAGT